MAECRGKSVGCGVKGNSSTPSSFDLFLAESAKAVYWTLVQ